MPEAMVMEQPTQGSVTVVEEPTSEGNQQEVQPVEAPTLTLRLRPRPTVTWGSDVINNEGMGKKSSKRCCIFHKKRAFDESESDESDSDCDDEEREKRWAQPKPGKPKAHQLYHG